MLTTHDDYLRLRIHREFKSKVVEYCKTNKIKMSKFVRQALKEKMDRDNIDDIEREQNQKTMSNIIEHQKKVSSNLEHIRTKFGLVDKK